MKLRSTKAAGSFCCHKEGSFELLIHMEADPRTHSYCEFDFASVLSERKARELDDAAAYSLHHSAGQFVVSVHPSLTGRTARYRELWHEADICLAAKNTWLFSVSAQELRRQPRWGAALKIAGCARADVNPADHARVVEHLGLVGSASMHDCMKLCRTSSDSFDAVLKLISCGVLVRDDDELDLTPASCVRLQSAAPCGETVDWI